MFCKTITNSTLLSSVVFKKDSLSFRVFEDLLVAPWLLVTGAFLTSLMAGGFCSLALLVLESVPGAKLWCIYASAFSVDVGRVKSILRGTLVCFTLRE